MIAKITKHDIEMGDKQKGRSCPIARALHREMEEYCYVGSTYIYCNLAPAVQFDCDEKLNKWILDFDEGNEVDEFQVCLDQNEKKAFYMEVGDEAIGES